MNERKTTLGLFFYIYRLTYFRHLSEKLYTFIFLYSNPSDKEDSVTFGWSLACMRSSLWSVHILCIIHFSWYKFPSQIFYSPPGPKRQNPHFFRQALRGITSHQCYTLVRPNPLVISNKTHIYTTSQSLPLLSLETSISNSLSSSYLDSTYSSVLHSHLTSHFLNVVILEHPKPHQSLPSLKSRSPQVHTTNFSTLSCSSLCCLHTFHLVNFMETSNSLSYKIGTY